jgi:hypothetical protein
VVVLNARTEVRAYLRNNSKSTQAFVLVTEFDGTPEGRTSPLILLRTALAGRVSLSIPFRSKKTHPVSRMWGVLLCWSLEEQEEIFSLSTEPGIVFGRSLLS